MEGELDQNIENPQRMHSDRHVPQRTDMRPDVEI